MSSNYRILCLSHDPALELDTEFNHPAQAVDAAINAMDAKPGASLVEHFGCDLLVGRVSGALIELCCPRPGPTTGCSHNTPQWIDIDWLRLLAGALQAGPDPKLKTAIESMRHVHRCWPFSRLLRLRYELGLEERPS